MNKNELVTVVTSKLNNVLSKQEVLSVINAMIEAIQESVVNNQKVSLKSFLTFEPIIRPAKQGTSFGKDWSKAELHSVKVKISNSFKKLLASKSLS
jgi:nucleoid DNA-binding protein